MITNFRLTLALVGLTYCLVLPMEVLLCDSNARIRQFHISSPQGCQQGETTYVGRCRGSIYSPLKNLVVTPAFACTLITTRWEGVNYFFGSKVSKDFDPISQPLDVSRCQKIANSKRDLILGELVGFGDGYYATKNVIKRTYSWPSKSTAFAQNIVLMQTNITYDHLKEKISTPLAELKHCSIAYGTCKTEKYTFIWNWNDNRICPDTYNDSAKEQPVDFHYTLAPGATSEVAEHVLSHITLPELGMTFYSRLRCPEIVKTCFGEDVRPTCLPNGEFLLTTQCSRDTALEYQINSLYPKFKIPNDEAATFNYEHQMVGAYSKNITKAITTLECRLSNALSSVINILSKTHPSEALSFLTQQEVGARSRGDLLEMLSCRNVTVNIAPQMIFDGQFVSRPLVTFFLHNESRTAQFYPDAKAYLQIGFFEKYNHLHQASFFISGRYYNFQNYTLVRSTDKHIIPLHFNLGIPAVALPAVNFENLFRDRPNRQDVSNDFANLVSLVQQNNLLTEKMTTYFSAMGELPSGHLGIKVDQLVSGNLSSYLSYIRNPFVIFILLILQIINQCWGIILLIYAIREIRARCRKSPEKKEEVTPSEGGVHFESRRDEVFVPVTV